MKEMIELLSAISILIASLAGLTAVNKWKKERFEKVKIESIEAFERSVNEMREKIENIIREDVYKYVKDMRLSKEGKDASYSQMEFFYETKKDKIDELGNKVRESEKLLRVYSGYAGNRMRFSYKYFFSTYIIMDACLNHIMISADIHDDNVSNNFSSYVFNFLKSEKNFVDILDYTMIQSPSVQLFLMGKDEVNVIDRRHIFHDKFMNMVAAEKISMHSLFFYKLIMNIKIFFIRSRLAGRVVCISDKYVVVIGNNGELIRNRINGETYKEIEGIHRKHIFYKLIKSDLVDFFRN